MPRTARIVVPGAYHHVTQRGNNKQDVFFVDDDRRAYLQFLREQGERYGFRLEGYCLMTNHIHAVGVPAREESLAKAMGRTHFLYAQYVNKMHARSGHLWQNRFYSCAIDDDQAPNALCYVELNPVWAGLANKAWEYPWSSAAAHCGLEEDNGYLDLSTWRAETSAEDWRATLTEAVPNKDTQAVVRRNTLTGRPLGSDSFLSKAEAVLGRRVRPLPMGRPKGWRKNKAAKDAGGGIRDPETLNNR